MTHWNLWVPANQTLKRQTGEWVGLLWSQVLCSKGDGVYIAMYTEVLKRHQKAGYRHTNSVMHVLQTYHQNDHNTVAKGKESQIKALSKLETKHTKITVVVSPEERDRGPWTASLTFSHVTHFHSKWLHQVERKRALHWQVFQVRYSLIGMETSGRAFLFLAWVGCQKSVYCLHHCGGPVWTPLPSTRMTGQRHRSLAHEAGQLSLWHLCACVFGKEGVTADGDVFPPVGKLPLWEYGETRIELIPPSNKSPNITLTWTHSRGSPTINHALNQMSICEEMCLQWFR